MSEITKGEQYLNDIGAIETPKTLKTLFSWLLAGGVVPAGAAVAENKFDFIDGFSVSEEALPFIVLAGFVLGAVGGSFFNNRAWNKYDARHQAVMDRYKK